MTVRGAQPDNIIAEKTTNVERKAGRLGSLDALRGLTVLGMILVNSTAGVRKIDGPVFPLLLHAQWAGFTIADTVFPAFILMIGVSIAISSRPG